MKNYIQYLALFLFAILTLNSCQKEENHSDLSRLDIVKSLSDIDIERIVASDKDEIEAIFSKYDEHLNFGELDTIESNTVYYNGLTGKAVVIDYGAWEQSENSLIFILSGNNDVDTYLDYSLTWDNEIGYVTVYDEDEFFMSAKIDSEYNVINLFFNKIHGSGSYLDCLQGAVSACVNDGECAFICGVIWKWCLGSVAAACLGHHYL